MTADLGEFPVLRDGPEMRRDFAERLRVEGIAVRPLEQWGAPQAIRITIGTPEQNRRAFAGAEEIEEFVMARVGA